MSSQNSLDADLVEFVARAMVMVAEVNQDPDEVISFDSEDGVWSLSGPRWHAFRSEARKQIAAYEAICKFHLTPSRNE